MEAQSPGQSDKGSASRDSIDTIYAIDPVDSLILDDKDWMKKIGLAETDLHLPLDNNEEEDDDFLGEIKTFNFVDESRNLSTAGSYQETFNNSARSSISQIILNGFCAKDVIDSVRDIKEEYFQEPVIQTGSIRSSETSVNDIIQDTNITSQAIAIESNLENQGCDTNCKKDLKKNSENNNAQTTSPSLSNNQSSSADPEKKMAEDQQLLTDDLHEEDEELQDLQSQMHDNPVRNIKSIQNKFMQDLNKHEVIDFEPRALAQISLLNFILKTFANFIINFMIVGPAMTLCWRSVWTGFNQLTELSRPLGPDIPSVVVDGGLASTTRFKYGLFITAIAVLISVCFNGSKRKIHYILWKKFPFGYKVYAYWFSPLLAFVASMMFWKGSWDLCQELDHASLSNDTRSHKFLLAILCCAVLVLTLAGYSRNLAGFPLELLMDRQELLYNHTYLQNAELNILRYREVFHDILKSTFEKLCEFPVVLCWYVVWLLSEDLATFLISTEPKSNVDCFLTFGIGVFIGAVITFLQFPIYLVFLKIVNFYHKHKENRCARALAWTLSRLLNLIMATLGLWSSVSCLRGLWVLLDPKDMLNNQFRSGDHGFTLVLGILILKLTGSFMTLSGGVQEDVSAMSYKIKNKGFLFNCNIISCNAIDLTSSGTKLKNRLNVRMLKRNRRTELQNIQGSPDEPNGQAFVVSDFEQGNANDHVPNLDDPIADTGSQVETGPLDNEADRNDVPETDGHAHRRKRLALLKNSKTQETFVSYSRDGEE